MATTASTLAQVGQVVTMGLVVAATTVLAVAGRIDATEALSVILGVAGIGSGVSVAVHNLASLTAPREAATPPPEVPRVG